MAVKRILVFSFILFVISALSWPQPLEMKSVTVAGFINKGKSNRDNINAIMTKSLSTFLSKISKNITPYNEVEKAALEDNFWNKKELKSDQAINIAQRFSTEQVITGDYIVNDNNETISIKVYVYNVINGQLLFQRNYKGSAGPDIFDTIDKMILDVSGLLAGKPIKLGYVKIAIKQEGVSYQLFVNDGFIKLINSKEGYIDKFVSGQSVDISLKADQSDKEVLKRKLEIQSGKTNVLEYNPTGVLILETIESGIDVYMNGTNIGKTDNSGELKITNVGAGKQNVISIKNGSGLIAATNIVINEAELKVVVFKTALQNNSIPLSEKQSQTGDKSLPWYARFTLSFNTVYKFPFLNPNSRFWSAAANVISSNNNNINNNNNNYYNTNANVNPYLEGNLLYRAFDFLAVGIFMQGGVGGNNNNNNNNNNNGSLIGFPIGGGMIRIIPFFFRNHLDGETMFYVDLKAGREGIDFGLNNGNGDNNGFYSAIALGGAVGWVPGIQLAVSAGYEYCVFNNIPYMDTNGNAEILSDSSGTVTLDTSCFFVQLNLLINF